MEIDNSYLNNLFKKISKDISISDIEKLSYPNIKTYELILFRIDIPERIKKSTESLTYLAILLAKNFNYKVLPETESFIATDGRLGINIERSK